MKKIHKEVSGGWTNCGIHVTIVENLTFDNEKVTCTRCIRGYAPFIRAVHLDYMLHSFLGIFTSVAQEGDLDAFKAKHLGLKWSMGLEEAIKEFADRKSSKELMIVYLIDSIMEIEKKEREAEI